MKRRLSDALERWLPRGGFARGASVLVSGTAMAQAIAIAAAPVLTRLYKPAMFGDLQIFISLLAIVLVACAGRYEIALLLPREEEAALDVLATAALCVAGSTFMTVVGVVVCRQHWILPSSARSIGPFLFLLPLSVLGGGMYQVLSYWEMRRNRFEAIATTKFAQVFTQVFTQAGLGALTHHPFGLILGDSVGRATGSGRFLRNLFHEHKARLRAITAARIRRAAVRYREFPLVSTWGALVNASGLAIPSLFLAQYYGGQTVGWFALVNRVLAIPVALVGTSISQVYSSRAATLSQEDPSALMALFQKTIWRAMVAGFFPCTLFMLFAPVAFHWIFGALWGEAGHYARELAIMFYAAFVSAPVTMTLVVLERQRWQFAWDLLWLIFTIASMILPHSLGWPARATLMIYGACMSLLYLVHIVQSYYAIRLCVLRGPAVAASTLSPEASAP